jgi:TATA-binding protein-associated factor Taf7
LDQDEYSTTRVPVEETQASNGVVAFLEDQAEEQQEQEEQRVPSQPDTPAVDEEGDEQEEEEEEEEDSDDVRSIHSFLECGLNRLARILKSSPRRQAGRWTSGLIILLLVSEQS